MIKRPYKIYCVNCKSNIYMFEGEFCGKFNFSMFKPATSGIKSPSSRELMSCPSCGKTWYMLNSKGGIIVLTDKGWKPREPSGIPIIFRPGDSGMFISHPDGKTEFSDAIFKRS